MCNFLICNLQSANLQSANLQSANLQSANLKSAITKSAIKITPPIPNQSAVYEDSLLKCELLHDHQNYILALFSNQ
ncbi:MAG: pentapeptide repeat-containing protein [Bacteroidetes bacterium]|nr:pentapeptide repeat-containing protein [Bacteroidota bacterium]